MQLVLPPNFQRMIDERVESGKYPTPEDVVAAALSMLDQKEAHGEFSEGELDALLAEGEAAIRRGEVMEGDAAFAELRRRNQLRRENTKS